MTLLDYERRPTFGRCDVLAQVSTVDGFPNLLRQRRRLTFVEFGKVAKETVRVLKHRAPQQMEALDEPVFDERFVGIEIDREVEVVAHEFIGARVDLQHVQTLQNEDVGLMHGDLRVGQDVVDDVAVDGCRHLGFATLDRPQELEQPTCVVTFRKPFAIQDAACREFFV